MADFGDVAPLVSADGAALDDSPGKPHPDAEKIDLGQTVADLSIHPQGRVHGGEEQTFDIPHVGLNESWRLIKTRSSIATYSQNQEIEIDFSRVGWFNPEGFFITYKALLAGVDSTTVCTPDVHNHFERVWMTINEQPIELIRHYGEYHTMATKYTVAKYIWNTAQGEMSGLIRHWPTSSVSNSGVAVDFTESFNATYDNSEFNTFANSTLPTEVNNQVGLSIDILRTALVTIIDNVARLDETGREGLGFTPSTTGDTWAIRPHIGVLNQKKYIPFAAFKSIKLHLLTSNFASYVQSGTAATAVTFSEIFAHYPVLKMHDTFDKSARNRMKGHDHDRTPGLKIVFTALVTDESAITSNGQTIELVRNHRNVVTLYLAFYFTANKTDQTKNYYTNYSSMAASGGQWQLLHGGKPYPSQPVAVPINTRMNEGIMRVYQAYGIFGDSAFGGGMVTNTRFQKNASAAGNEGDFVVALNLVQQSGFDGLDARKNHIELNINMDSSGDAKKAIWAIEETRMLVIFPRGQIQLLLNR